MKTPMKNQMADQTIEPVDAEANTAKERAPETAHPSGEEFDDEKLSERDRDAMKNTDRPAGDWSVVPDRSPSYEAPTIASHVDEALTGETSMTPPTEDRSAVKAPDDTFPGSGPLY